MFVNEFYKKRKCQKQYEISRNMVSIDERPAVLSSVTKKICLLLKENANEEDIEKMIRGELERYKDSWFVYDWQKVAMQNQDLKLFMRFVHWWRTGPFQGGTIIDTNRLCQYSMKDGSTLDSYASIIYKSEQGTAALRLSFSAHTKSLSGRSNSTNTATDLNNMVLKYVLEKNYPGIVLYDITIKNGQDSAESIHDEILTGAAAKNNVHCIPYTEYNDKADFLWEDFQYKMEEVINEKEKPNCYMCYVSDACKNKADVFYKEKEMERAAYTIPNYVGEQNKIIQHDTGCMSVLAGPGSGKTATLIGRAKQLVTKGVESEFILMISFSREATREIKLRAGDILKKWEIPNITTVHALAYNILKGNEKRFGRKFELLAVDKRRALIENMTYCFPRLKGFNANILDGEKGFICQLDRRLSLFYKDREEFKEKYPDAQEDLISFAQEYVDIIKANGYMVDYDEMISLCYEYLSKDKELTEIYRRQYQYIMVDEYQDISKEQAELIYLLAGDNPNLLVVGDDDQNVYTFRGGTPKYLREFHKKFGGECIKLSQNFRSTGSIVSAASEIIKKNTERIEKHIFSKIEGGNPPYLCHYSDIEERTKMIDSCISDIENKGYSLNDIAIIARKNSTLDELQKTLSHETVLAKAYLKNDCLLGYIHDVLCIYFDDRNRDKAACRLMTRFEGKVIDKDFIISQFPYLQKETSSKRIVALLAESIQALESYSYDDIIELIDEIHAFKLQEFYARIDYMIRYEDTKRATVPECNKVVLITSHDAKGKEWKAVIIADANEYKEKTDGVNLLYVAVTRTEELLYAFAPKGTGTLLDGVAVQCN